MRTITGAVIVLALCGTVILGTTILENRGAQQEARSQIAIRKLDAQIAESDRAKAEAASLPEAIRENWEGLTEHAETIANLERDRAQTDALIDLALSDLRAEQEWRRYVQGMFALVLVSLIAGGALYLLDKATRNKDAGRVRDAT